MTGTLIAGMGLPGSGKSTVLGALADLLIRQEIQANVYKEPEEAEWPDAVTKRTDCGHITALTWFRSVRVPMLYQAEADRKNGKVAIVDSYYDKLIHLYMHNPEFNWLLPPEESYRSIYAQLAKQDFESLPDADCVVTFVVDEPRWQQLVRGRGRELDRQSKILDSYAMLPSFIAAAKAYCNERKIPHVIFNNTQHTLADAAESLLEELRRHGIAHQ